MRYRSTRSEEKISAPQALLQGLAKDGGLYVPEMLPAPFIEYNSLRDLSYKELASFVLKRFLTDIPENDLKKLYRCGLYGNICRKRNCARKTYDRCFFCGGNVLWQDLCF